MRDHPCSVRVNERSCARDPLFLHALDDQDRMPAGWHEAIDIQQISLYTCRLSRFIHQFTINAHGDIFLQVIASKVSYCRCRLVDQLGMIVHCRKP